MNRHFPLSLFIAGLIAVPGIFLRAGEKKKEKVDPATIHGKIQFVKSFPDYKVKAVTSFPNLKVKIVQTMPGPGEWQIVKSFPDYKIEMVDSFPDFTVEFSGGVPERAK